MYRSTDYDRFKQVIIFATKTSFSEIKDGITLTDMARDAKTMEPTWSYEYRLKAKKDLDDIECTPRRVNTEKLKEIHKKYDQDWRKLTARIPTATEMKSPLMPLRKSHLAQVLASGLIDGLVTHPETGEKLVVKGTVSQKTEITRDDKYERTITKHIVSIITLNENGEIKEIKQ